MSSDPKPAPLKLHDLDLTIVSAKHLKNVNWKNGDLKPYVILWVDPERRQATRPDDSGSTRPVWNERFIVPLILHPRDSILSLEIFHSKPSETSKPLVGALQFDLRDLLFTSEEEMPGRIRTLDLKRPSGRPHGKIRIKITLVERPMETYPSGYYYSTPPPPPMQQPHNFRGYSPPFPPPPPYPSAVPQSLLLSSAPPPPQHYSFNTYPDTHSRYYSAYYSPPPPPRQFIERHSSFVGPGPSAPVDYTPYDYHKRNNEKPGMGIGTGLTIGAVAGVLGGIALDEGVKYEEKIASTSRDDRYINYRTNY